MMKQELLGMIDLLERMRDLKHLWLEDPTPDPFMDMALFLMRRHLTGQLVTPSSLAHAAKVPYTTATRRVTRMQEQGLLDLRPRTATGKSFSVHPSPKLISKVTSFLIASKDAVEARPKVVGKGRVAEDADLIPPPSVAPASLVKGKPGFEGSLDILVPDDPVYSISKRLQRELSYLMGGKLRFIEAPIDNLRNTMLENAKAPRSRFDVAAVDLPMIAEFAHRGILAPLDDVAAESNVVSADFISAAWRGAIVDGQQYAIPILINPQLLFYRKDLFAKAAVQAPVSTSQLLHLARKFHAPSKGRYGVSWTAARGAPVGQAFIQFLADFGQPVFQLERSVGGYKTSRSENRPSIPTIDTDCGQATAHFMIELLKVSAPNALNMTWDGQVDLMRKGQVAMAYEWAGRAAQLTGFAASGDMGFLPHPVGDVASDPRTRSAIAPVGGFAFGIPSNIDPARLTTAWAAIEWLSSPEVNKLLVQHSGHVTPRISVGSDPDVRRLSPVIAAVDRMAKRGQIRLWPRPPVMNYSSVVSILGEEIHDMLSGHQSVSQALKRSQKRAEAVM